MEGKSHMTEGDFIRCVFPMVFPLKENENGIRFTEESLEKNIGEKLEKLPVIYNGSPIATLTGDVIIIYGKEKRSYLLEAMMLGEFLPEIVVNKKECIDGVDVITDFEIKGLSVVKT